MKFLVSVKNRTGVRGPDDPVAAARAAKKWLNSLLEDGTVDCAYNVVASDPIRGIAIINADSHEALMEQLFAFPHFPYVDLQVLPLSDINHYFDKSIEIMQKLAGK